MLPVIGLTSRTLPFPANKKQRPTETVTRTYVEAVERAGGLCMMIPNLDVSRAAAYLDRIDALLLTGGDDPDPELFGEEPHPNIEMVDSRRDLFEVSLVRGAVERAMPVFGICRGAQLLNIALGGDIYQDIGSQTESSLQHTQRRLDDGPWHEIDVEPNSRLGSLLEGSLTGRSMRVNSFHHQACRRAGDGLTVCARARDGLPEALEMGDHPFFLGVQWHPELGGNGSEALFSAFIKAAQLSDSASHSARK
jgi:putative glutamine amidotransferase